MKILNNTRKTMIAAVIVLSTLAVSNKANAETGKDLTPVAFKYVGSNNNAPIFQLSFSNEKIETFVITIRDKENTLFTETVKGDSKSLLRKYQFVNENSSTATDDQITIEVRNISNKSVVEYTFNVNEEASNGKELIAAKW